MERSKSNIPQLDLQSLAVDFIDNHLDKYHLGFASPPARYDPALDSFIVLTPEGVPEMQSSQPSTTLQQGNMLLPPRPAAQPVAALQFWDQLFTRAMDEFKLVCLEPKGRVEAGFSIRNKRNWTAVYDQLEKAKDHYFKGRRIESTFRRVFRSMADRAAPVALDLTKLVPDMSSIFISPVVGSIQIMLEVWTFPPEP